MLSLNYLSLLCFSNHQSSNMTARTVYFMLKRGKMLSQPSVKTKGPITGHWEQLETTGSGSLRRCWSEMPTQQSSQTDFPSRGISPLPWILNIRRPHPKGLLIDESISNKTDSIKADNRFTVKFGLRPTIFWHQLTGRKCDHKLYLWSEKNVKNWFKSPLLWVLHTRHSCTLRPTKKQAKPKHKINLYCLKHKKNSKLAQSLLTQFQLWLISIPVT